MSLAAAVLRDGDTEVADVPRCGSEARSSTAGRQRDRRWTDAPAVGGRRPGNARRGVGHEGGVAFHTRTAASTGSSRARGTSAGPVGPCGSGSTVPVVDDEEPSGVQRG